MFGSGSRNMPWANTKNYCKYVAYFPHCPKCGRYGSLYAKWTRTIPYTRLYGPYFTVSHRKSVWNRGKYDKLREAGIPPSKARLRSYDTPYQGNCYIGRDLELEKKYRIEVKMGLSDTLTEFVEVPFRHLLEEV